MLPLLSSAPPPPRLTTPPCLRTAIHSPGPAALDVHHMPCTQQLRPR